jgi:hypothetical protein
LCGFSLKISTNSNLFMNPFFFWLLSYVVWDNEPNWVFRELKWSRFRARKIICVELSSWILSWKWIELSVNFKRTKFKLKNKSMLKNLTWLNSFLAVTTTTITRRIYWTNIHSHRYRIEIFHLDYELNEYRLYLPKKDEYNFFVTN